MIGKTVSHYKITQRLGAGGMGQVFLAEDLQQSRLAAVKILPEELAEDHERMKRFLREAKAASVISHPNIAQIFEIGEMDKTRFIAMEYVEGETLEARINRKPLDILEAIEIGIQIADGLEGAHAKGVVHRDIKPGNIMITPDGRVKVLDFGLAKITRTGLDDFSTTKTEVGTALGTVHYMSPEQALGIAIDYRSDIFSLGIVLYESVTGRQPFAGRNIIETVERIIREQPDAISRSNRNIPVEFEQIILKCLEKDPKRRYQSCREVSANLQKLKLELAKGAVAADALRSTKNETPVAEKSPRRWTSYLEFAITLVVILILTIYVIKSCH